MTDRPIPDMNVNKDTDTNPNVNMNMNINTAAEVNPTQQGIPQQVYRPQGVPMQAAAQPIPQPMQTPQPVPQAYKPPKRVFTSAESVFGLCCILLGYLFVKLVLAGGLGVGTLVFFSAFMIISGIFAKKSAVKTSKHSVIYAALTIAFSLCFLISSNGFIKTLDLLFVMTLAALWSFSLNNPAYKGSDDSFVFTFFSAILGKPFSEFGSCPAAVSSLVGKSKGGKNIGYILIGLLIALPVTIISGLLLISADRFFSEMMESLFSSAGEKLIINGFQIVIGIPAAFFIFGMLFSAAKNRTDSKLNYESCANIRRSFRISPPVVMYSSVMPLCLIYVMFFISQISYFISAFQNKLPEEYSMAEYARKGFFELFAVAVINLLVIIFINLLCRSNTNDDSRPRFLKVLTSLLSVFTLVLIATAVSKMVMYIKTFGLTRLRVYTTWFMALLAVLFLLIIIRQAAKINLAKTGAVAFTVMFAALSFCNIDLQITRYNIYAYTSGMVEEFDANHLRKLSDDAVYAVVPLLDSSDETLRDAAEQYFEDRYFDGELTESNDWRRFNFPGYYACEQSMLQNI